MKVVCQHCSTKFKLEYALRTASDPNFVKCPNEKCRESLNVESLLLRKKEAEDQEARS